MQQLNDIVIQRSVSGETETQKMDIVSLTPILCIRVSCLETLLLKSLGSDQKNSIYVFFVTFDQF